MPGKRYLSEQLINSPREGKHKNYKYGQVQSYVVAADRGKMVSPREAHIPDNQIE